MASVIKSFNQYLSNWLGGHYRATDERALHDLAAKDPDMHEALEGYAKHPEHDHAAALERMRKGIRPGADRPVFHFAFGKLAIAAASIGILALAIWFFNREPYIDPVPQMAQTESVPPPNAEIQTSEPIAVLDAEQKATTPDPVLSKTAAKTAKSSEPAAPTSVASASEARNMGDLADVQKDEVATLAGKPSEPIVASAPSPVSAPSAPSREVENLGNARAEASKAPGQAKKKTKEASKAADTAPYFETDRAAQAKAEETTLVAAPSEGWDAFELYLRSARVYPQEAMARGVNGSVRLSFWTDSNGHPIQVRVIRPLGYGCDEEAIRLLTEGPVWAPANARNGTVEIRFPR